MSIFIEETNSIPTVEDMLESTGLLGILDKSDYYLLKQAMVDFAKFHVEAALKSAVKNATTEENEKGEYGYVNSSSILNSYDINNII